DRDAPIAHRPGPGKLFKRQHLCYGSDRGAVPKAPRWLTRTRESSARTPMQRKPTSPLNPVLPCALLSKVSKPPERVHHASRSGMPPANALRRDTQQQRGEIIFLCGAPPGPLEAARHGCSKRDGASTSWESQMEKQQAVLIKASEEEESRVMMKARLADPLDTVICEKRGMEGGGGTKASRSGGEVIQMGTDQQEMKGIWDMHSPEATADTVTAKRGREVEAPR
ncbi:hypothetical protein JOQ06_028768, partial [Pogonophryne albipinna]